MNPVDATARALSAAELRKLPAVERNARLAAAAALAEVEYRTNRELTDFEAFGLEDSDGADAEPQSR
jgi:hypothetical protein